MAHVSQIGNENLVSDYIFPSQGESHSVPDMGFMLAFTHFVIFGVIENRFTKIISSSILMEIVTIPVVLVDELYFHMHYPIKLREKPYFSGPGIS